MTTEEREKRRKASEIGRQRLIEDLGLTNMPYNVAATIKRYDWPAACNGTQYDRSILITIFSDGTWSAYLDNPHLSIDATIGDFRVMAKAGETLSLLEEISAKIDDFSGSPSWTSDEHDEIAKHIAAARGVVWEE